MSEDDLKDPNRRDFLGKVTAAVGAVGAAAACWPLINSMNPATNVLSRASTEVDLSGIPRGESKTVEWQGKPVFVVHRTQDQISAMEASQGVKDPQPDKERVVRPEWLIIVGICTHLGCVPNRRNDGWNCPCHGSQYDISGRILKGPAPRNLEVPPYEFVTENKIIIGKA
jgi:ubiquinol-cytochrome c reductase iron-sulfur subunit